MNKDERSAASTGADTERHRSDDLNPTSAPALSLPIQRLGSAMEGLDNLKYLAEMASPAPWERSPDDVPWSAKQAFQEACTPSIVLELIEALRQRPGAQAASEPVAQVVADPEALPFRKVAWLSRDLPAGTMLYASPAGERPAQAEPLMRMVPLSLLVRAREHAPYMGETWKALNEAMTTLGAQALDDAGTCHGCGVGRERLRLYLRGSVPQVMKTCDHCHIELFGEQECDANLEAMTDHCGAQAPSTAAVEALIARLRDYAEQLRQDPPEDDFAADLDKAAGFLVRLAAPSTGGAETAAVAQVVADEDALPFRKVAWLGRDLPVGTMLYAASVETAASPASKEDGSHE